MEVRIGEERSDVVTEPRQDVDLPIRPPVDSGAPTVAEVPQGNPIHQEPDNENDFH